MKVKGSEISLTFNDLMSFVDVQVLVKNGISNFEVEPFWSNCENSDMSI